MKTFLFSLLSLPISLALTASTAMASDLTNDLKTPFSSTTSPFTNAENIALAKPVADDLKTLIEMCAVSPTEVAGPVGRVYSETLLKTNCEQALRVSHVSTQQGHTVLGHRLHVIWQAYDLYVVSWDRVSSEGDNEMDLAVYSTDGHRLAVYPSLSVEGSVVDGLAHVLGAKISTAH